MPDREKVIKCLEACTGEQNDCAGHTCPYWDFDGDVGCRTQMELDALALLKEQGTQKFLVDENGKITPLPIVIPNCPLKEQETANLYKCPNCGTWVSAENVVRCKDCKKRKTDECLMYWNEIKDDETWDDNWFCADGVKRE